MLENILFGLISLKISNSVLQNQFHYAFSQIHYYFTDVDFTALTILLPRQ